MDGDSSRELITREDLSDDDLARLRRSGIVAVDCEMTGLNPHRDLLCLVQLCDRDGTVAFVRTREWAAAHNLRALLLDESLTKVFHFALADGSFIVKHLGIMPRGTYCTKIASKLVRTYTQEHGLGALVRELFGVQLSKAQQTTDWYTGELSGEQLAYAANDVGYLIGIKERLDAKLEARGALPTGLSYVELNASCQAFLPTLIHLVLNGWRAGSDGDAASVFAH
jgi:ribonuclease D